MNLWWFWTLKVFQSQKTRPDIATTSLKSVWNTSCISLPCCDEHPCETLLEQEQLWAGLVSMRTWLDGCGLLLVLSLLSLEQGNCPEVSYLYLLWDYWCSQIPGLSQLYTLDPVCVCVCVCNLPLFPCGRSSRVDVSDLEGSFQPGHTHTHTHWGPAAWLRTMGHRLTFEKLNWTQSSVLLEHTWQNTVLKQVHIHYMLKQDV